MSARLRLLLSFVGLALILYGLWLIHPALLLVLIGYMIMAAVVESTEDVVPDEQKMRLVRRDDVR